MCDPADQYVVNGNLSEYRQHKDRPQRQHDRAGGANHEGKKQSLYSNHRQKNRFQRNPVQQETDDQLPDRSQCENKKGESTH